MSYVVLARKYRPRRFDQLVGQEHVVRALTNALEQQRLHHAYLFTGTRGIGKTTISRILAKSLNCTGPDGTGGITATPCGVCSACTEIDADRYMDYIELDAASNRSIDEIRDLIERAAYKPGIGRFKVFMIDEAHQLTKDAFNALLKTLEEPPDYLKFVLATTDPEKMLPTVLSRCLQFNLRPMAPDTVREHLQHVLDAEQVPADPGALRLLGRAARGSMRDALSLADQAIAYGGGRLDEAVVRAMLGSVDRSHARTLVDALARRDGAAVLAAVDGLRELGLSAAGTLEEMARLLQQMAVAQAVPGALDDADPETEGARALAGMLAPDETQLLYSIVLHGRAELGLMSDEYGALTMVLLRLLAFPPAGAARPAQAPAAAPAPKTPIAAARPATAAEPARVRRAAEPPPPWDDIPDAEPPAQPPAEARVAPLRAPSPPAMAVPAPAPPSVLGDRWADLVRRLDTQGAISALVRELAFQSGLRQIDTATAPATWHLVVERDSLRSPALRDKLAGALATELGSTLQLDLEPGVPADSPARRDAAERARRLAEAEQLIADDPVVRELMSQFNTARIVPGSVRPL
jgi:DNA polymerase-3 subunit gamma/tau